MAKRHPTESCVMGKENCLYGDQTPTCTILHRARRQHLILPTHERDSWFPPCSTHVCYWNFHSTGHRWGWPDCSRTTLWVAKIEVSPALRAIIQHTGSLCSTLHTLGFLKFICVCWSPCQKKSQITWMGIKISCYKGIDNCCGIYITTCSNWK